ncbi:RHS repeat protein [Tenacibaculum maritimum]|uniref:RHS repeat protein n=1 Tax=Tenacibaculum maritimum TaxID=107401 RepID=UPI00133009B0|nr:RHS repeat-associated core domain-containing protein [Tenacibaculum maritimum]
MDLNGRVRSIVGKDGFCNIRFQGQVYDDDIQLCYNRFRWYDDVDGRYISKDPIGLLSGEYGFYNYVEDSNGWVDKLGLSGNTYRNVDDIAKKYGGQKTGDNRFVFEGAGSKKRAKQAASEISGDLGSNPRTERRKDYRDCDNTFRDDNSNRVIGKKSSKVDRYGNSVNGYHDHDIGHDFDRRPHFNAWSESTNTLHNDNVHLYY